MFTSIHNVLLHIHNTHTRPCSCNSGHHSDTSSITCLETGWDSVGITCEANAPPSEPVDAESAGKYTILCSVIFFLFYSCFVFFYLCVYALDVGASVVLALLAIAILAGVVFLFVRMRKSKTAVNDSDFTPFGSVNA